MADVSIADYWVVNLVDRVLEVHRDPAADVAVPYGLHCRSITRLAPPMTVTPLAVPSAVILVAHLLP